MCLSIYCLFVVIKQKKIVSVCQLTASTNNNYYSTDIFSMRRYHEIFKIIPKSDNFCIEIKICLLFDGVIFCSIYFDIVMHQSFKKRIQSNLIKLKTCAFSLHFLIFDRYKLLRLLYQQHHLVRNIIAKDLLPIYLSLIGKPS